MLSPKKFVCTLKLSIKSVCLWACFHLLSPSVSGIRKVKEILLNLSMKCWNSALNALRFDSDCSSCTGRRSENTCSSSSGGAQEKRKDRMMLSLPPKSVEKLVWVPVSYFPPITLMYKSFLISICLKLHKPTKLGHLPLINPMYRVTP
jgi:hypothetical protein